MTLDPERLCEPLRMSPAGDHRYVVAPAVDAAPGQVVYGGQTVAQMIVASAAAHDDDGSEGKVVKSIHTVFPRAGDTGFALEYRVTTVQDGRSFGTDKVTCVQNGKVLAESIVLRSAIEADFVRHTTLERGSIPDAVVDAVADPRVFPGSIRAIVEHVGESNGAHVPVWIRYDGTPQSPVANQAIVAWATDGYLIAAAMQLHGGLGTGVAHRTLSTGVVGHTISFHDSADPTGWLLIDNESVWMGHGRAHGRGAVLADDGCLVATFAQDSMIRVMTKAQQRTDGRRAM